MNKTVYLVRHCSATGQEPEAPLTEVGFRQAERLADWLEDKGVEAIVCSPYVRANQSILPFAQRQRLEVRHDVRLKERVLCEGLPSDWQQLLAATFEDPDLALPGGESSREAASRAVAVIEECLHRAAQTTVLVTHGNLFTLLLGHFDETVGFAHWQRLTNPDIYRIEFPRAGLPKVTRVWE